jgi:large subunit ribosomal protein L25
MPYAISAATRTALRKRSKDITQTGHVPAVMYGHGIEPKTIQVGRSDFSKVYRAAGTSSLIDLALDGGSPVKVLIQEVQVHPISLEPAHVDFNQIRMDQELTVDVPLIFTGESAAVKGLAGTLVTSKDTISVKCLPADLPHEILVDLSVLATFEDAITIGSLVVPKGVEILDSADDVIANVQRPLTEEELKKLEEASAPVDVTAIKTEAEEKKAAEEAKSAEEAAAAEGA